MKILSQCKISAIFLALAGRICSATREELSGRNVARYEGKKYTRDESKSIVEATQVNTNRERKEQACESDERLMVFQLTTDSYGYETSFEWRTVYGIMATEPSNDENFDDRTPYTFKYCVKVGQQYRLKVKDTMGDGLCCGYGNGKYTVKIGGETIVDSTKAPPFKNAGIHTFRVKAPPRPPQRPANNRPQVGAVGKSETASNNSGCLTVTVKADRHPEELSWRILNKSGSIVATSPTMKKETPVSKQVCLPRGGYEFVIRDSFGDGLCCGSGNGEYSISMDGKVLIRKTHFLSEKRHKIQVKPNFRARMNTRDNEWLEAHNTRREKYHKRWGKSYVPLKWSPQLATQAKRWATKLLNDCESSSIKHEPNVMEGENLAKNRGSGKYGQEYAADNILTRWVENELTVGYPGNAHLTQALWRPSKYLGCGEAAKPYNNGRGMCRVQVCRYARAGNCNMAKANASVGNNWMQPMLQDTSKCEPDCAPEGCWSTD